MELIVVLVLFLLLAALSVAGLTADSRFDDDPRIRMP